MPRFLLRKGFLVVPAPEGGGRLVHVRTEDALALSEDELPHLLLSAEGGLEADAGPALAVAEHFEALGFLARPAAAAVPADFYELSLEEGPGPEAPRPSPVPAVAPVVPTVAPGPPAPLAQVLFEEAATAPPASAEPELIASESPAPAAPALDWLNASPTAASPFELLSGPRDVAATAEAPAPQGVAWLDEANSPAEPAAPADTPLTGDLHLEPVPPAAVETVAPALPPLHEAEAVASAEATEAEALLGEVLPDDEAALALEPLAGGMAAASAGGPTDHEPALTAEPLPPAAPEVPPAGHELAEALAPQAPAVSGITPAGAADPDLTSADEAVLEPGELLPDDELVLAEAPRPGEAAAPAPEVPAFQALFESTPSQLIPPPDVGPVTISETPSTPAVVTSPSEWNAALQQLPPAQRTPEARPAETAASASPQGGVKHPAPPSRRAALLTAGGVAALVVGVIVTFALRDTDTRGTSPRVDPPPVTASNAPDAGVAVAVAVAVAPPEPADAGLAAAEAPVVDAGAPAVAAVVPTPPEVEPDAGAQTEAAAPTATGEAWREVKVQARGRVKMADLVAPADGTLTWSVKAEQLVKRGAQVGQVSGSDGSPAPLLAGSVGLTTQQVADGAAVTKGQLLGTIIYFEAYARGLVTGPAPTPAWRCEVASAALGQKSACKVTGVAPKGAGHLVTATVEPRWFDDAADAVLRLAPP